MACHLSCSTSEAQAYGNDLVGAKDALNAAISAAESSIPVSQLSGIIDAATSLGNIIDPLAALLLAAEDCPKSGRGHEPDAANGGAADSDGSSTRSHLG